MFEKLIKNCLELRIDKCSFLKEEIQFLGYIIDKYGIKPCPSNIKAVSYFPIPKNFKDVQSFFDLTSYFRRFIQNYALITKPLYDFLKKDTVFRFNSAFEHLKNVLIQKPILSIYNPNSETYLHCDASCHGFGSILMQKQDGKFHPIFYFSKRISTSESKFHRYELELLCIIYSLRRFKIYLQGIEFKIFTDCNNTILALQKKEMNIRILRWTLKHRSNK